MPQFESASQSVMGNIDGIITNKKTNTPAVKKTDYSKQHEKQNTKGPKTQQIDAPANIVSSVITDTTNYSLGNPKGKYVIIEFFDHQCGWCKRTNKEMREAIKRAKNIRWIPIDTPIFGEASETIARYVLAAGEQGKYAQMHEAVGNAQGRLDEAALVKLGEDLKLNTKKLTADANGDKIRGKLAANKAYAKKLNINGVPMLIVDGKINPGALLGENLEKAVQASQAKK
jgi:protein-disulfide isomerase